MENKIFALVDCNTFYASCEKIFRPDLYNKPVIVLSNNDGCIVAMSKEAKSLGIKRGSPLFKSKDIIDKYNIACFSSNYELYGDISARIMELLSNFTPDIEIYSIDEAFLDLSCFKRIDLTEYALHIKNYIKKSTGIPVSIGIGPTKTLAKLATHIAKKYQVSNGVFNITGHPDIKKIFKSVGVHEIWGVGFQYTKLLHKHNVTTIYDFVNLKDEWVKKKMTSTGLLTLWELQGRSCIELEKYSPDKKQIISSRSFGKPVYLPGDLKESIAFHVTLAANDLRKQNCLCGGIIIFISTNRFKASPQYMKSISMLFDIPTDYTPALINYSHTACEKIYRSGFEYKRAGVVFINLTYKKNKQRDLFEDYKITEKQSNFMKTIDILNKKSEIIKTASCIGDKTWHMKRDFKSPNYTTDWMELPVAKI